MRLGLVLLTAGLLAGCQVTPPYRAPDTPDPVAQTALTASDARLRAAEPVSDWWYEFDDALLGQFVERSLEANKDRKSNV